MTATVRALRSTITSGVSSPDDIPEVELLDYEGWNEIYDLLFDTLDDVRNNLINWVDGVYGDVQDGDLDTEDLLTPRELAEMTAGEEDFNQAVADLMALNIATDLEREADIYLPDIGATLYGQLALTDESDVVEAGDTIDPEQADGSYYFTYDVSEGHGEWDAHEEGIDGGTLTFTEEPLPSTLFVVETVAGEQTEVLSEDFDEGDEEWTVDLSDDLDDAITSVESINFYAPTDETQFETVLLSQTFEVITFRDSDGNEHDTATFERSEPHDDENYISEDEWKDLQERHEELIEDYEDAQNGGGLFDGWFGGIGDSVQSMLIGAVVLVGAVWGLGQVLSN